MCARARFQFVDLLNLVTEKDSIDFLKKRPTELKFTKEQLAQVCGCVDLTVHESSTPTPVPSSRSSVCTHQCNVLCGNTPGAPHFGAQD